MAGTKKAAETESTETVAKKKTKRKAKYITIYSPFLMKDTKHELIGEPLETDNGRQQWARCSVSHHSQLINLDALQASAEKAASRGLDVRSVADAAAWGNVIMILIPDQLQKKVYEAEIRDHLQPGDALAFGHGFNIHYGQVVPPAGVDVFMVAPKSPGHLVRRTQQFLGKR